MILSTSRSWALAIAAAAWFLAVYLPGAGAGFIKDDYAWIEQSRPSSVEQVVTLFGRNTGFYRPVVALSFAADHALFGLSPRPYGLTNVLLAALAALSLARLARTLSLPSWAAVVAASVWALNPHGINMAIMWTSGRTALLLTLFATLAATSWMKGHAWRAAAWTLLALLSKEEAVALPFVLVAWSLVDGARGDSPRAARGSRFVWAAAPLFVALAVYAVLRSHSGAFTPLNAPSYYRLSSDWRVVVTNALEYLDRGATLAVAVVIVATIVARRLPAMTPDMRARMMMGAVWFVGGYAVTVFVPVRSSLYACFPSVGAALIAAAWLAALVRSESDLRLVPAVAVVCVLAVASTPIYWIRNERWVGAGRISTSVFSQLPGIVGPQPRGATIVIRDGPQAQKDVAAAFGDLLPAAVRLATGRSDVTLQVKPPSGGNDVASWCPPSGSRAACFVLDGLVLQPAF